MKEIIKKIRYQFHILLYYWNALRMYSHERAIGPIKEIISGLWELNFKRIVPSLLQFLVWIVISQHLVSNYGQTITEAFSSNWWEGAVKGVVVLLSVPAVYLVYFLANFLFLAPQKTFFAARDDADTHNFGFVDFRLKEIREFESPNYYIESINNKTNSLYDMKVRVAQINLNGDSINLSEDVFLPIAKNGQYIWDVNKMGGRGDKALFAMLESSGRGNQLKFYIPGKSSSPNNIQQCYKEFDQNDQVKLTIIVDAKSRNAILSDPPKLEYFAKVKDGKLLVTTVKN